MPIYEYKCENCGKVVEVLTAMGQDNAAPQSCGCGNGAHFARVYSTFAARDYHLDAVGPAPCGREGCCRGCAMDGDE